MSKEAVIKLIESAEINPNLKKQLYNADNPEIVLKIATQKGYQFSEAELIEVMQEKQLSFASEEELSEEQLESVVGGKNDKAEKHYYTNEGHKVVYK